MMIYFVITLLLGFVIGWTWRDCKWVKAAKTGKVVAVDGVFYKVKTFNPENSEK
jgi:hypothetical protein